MAEPEPLQWTRPPSRAPGTATMAVPCRVRFHLGVGDEIVSRNPLGSVTSNARLPHSVSCGSESSLMPAAFARVAVALISCAVSM